MQSCPANSKRDSNSGICVCSAGYLLNRLNTCVSICPSNSYFDTTTSNCICNTNYQMVNGVCNQCGQNTAYDAASRSCVAKFVGKVGPTGTVVTVVCQPNEVIENGICQCDKNSIKSGTRCTPCPPASYKPTESNQCLPCSSYCSTCRSNKQCVNCNKGFKIANQACEEVCGDGMKFILPCDDGNTVSGDGCSSTCQIEPGFACNGGSATRPDTCSKLNANTKISISIGLNSPTYVSTGIITEFVVQPPVRRSREELHHMFSLIFSNNKPRPMGMRLSQGDDLTSVRCFFSYNGNLPNQIFTVKFIIRDDRYGEDSVTIMYNSLLNPVKAAIAYMGGASSDELKWYFSVWMMGYNNSSLLFECRARTCKRRVVILSCSLETDLPCRSQTDRLIRQGCPQTFPLLHHHTSMDRSHLQDIRWKWSGISQALQRRKGYLSKIIINLYGYTWLPLAIKVIRANSIILSANSSKFGGNSRQTVAISREDGC